MKVTLLHYTPLEICSHAIRTCWQSFDKSDNGGIKDKALIDRVGNKYKHSSTLEHLVYSFSIQGISRAVLIEITRHRITSYSVASSRYILAKELKKEKPFACINKTINEKLVNPIERASKYLVFTGDEFTDSQSVTMLELLRQNVMRGKSNDITKYNLIESFKTELTMSINLRSLQNLLSLRLSKSALWEIQDLSCEIIKALPKEHLYLIEDIVKEQISKNKRIEHLSNLFNQQYKG